MITVISFIDWYWPGYRAGGVLKAFANQVAQLEGHFYFKIITRNVDYQHDEPYDNVRSDAWNKVASNAEVYYLSAQNLNYGNLKRLVNDTDFDVAYIHGIYSPWFSILPIHMVRRKGAKRIVVSAHGMLGRHALAVKSGRKQLFLKLFRTLGYYRELVFHAANEAERDDVLTLMGKKTKVVVAEELPMKVHLPEWQARTKTPGELNLCYIARIAPEKNTAFAIECLTQIKKGQVQFNIFGPVYEKAYWDECQNHIARCPANVSVSYHGSLDGARVLETLRSHHAMFMPTTGENFGHTILESFMAATPVIISQNTPWRDLESIKAGWDISLTDKLQFANVIERLASMDQNEYNELSQGAYKKAQAFLSDRTIIQQNIQLLMP